MLALTDSQFRSVIAAAASLPVEQRSAFLQRLAAKAERSRITSPTAAAVEPSSNKRLLRTLEGGGFELFDRKQLTAQGLIGTIFPGRVCVKNKAPAFSLRKITE